jgi:integrase
MTPRFSKKIRYRFLNRFVTRHGKELFYFRRAGERIPLTAEFETPEFFQQYAAALAGRPVPAAVGGGAPAAKPETLNGVIESLIATAHYQNNLKPHSQRAYRAGFRKLQGEFGNFHIAKFTHAQLATMIDRTARTRPGSARELLRVMRAIFSHAKTLGYRADDPTAGLKKAPLKNPDGHYSWLDEDIAQYRAYHAIGTAARLAFEIALNTGMRRSDIVRVGRQHVRADGKIRIMPEKTEGDRIWVTIPMHPDLAAAIAAMPARDSGLAFLGNPATGRDYTSDTFGKAFAAWCTEAGLPAKCRAHGLRKAIVRILIDLGVEILDIMAITGHRDPKTFMVYARDRSQEKLASRAFDKLIASGAAS